MVSTLLHINMLLWVCSVLEHNSLFMTGWIDLFSGDYYFMAAITTEAIHES